MADETDIIKWGETYDVSVTPQDANGDDIVMDGSWSAEMVVTTKLGGPVFVEPPIAIVGGKAEVSIDTGDEPWAPGRYIYDVRLTDPDGHDQWTEPIVLILENRNTPNT